MVEQRPTNICKSSLLLKGKKPKVRWSQAWETLPSCDTRGWEHSHSSSSHTQAWDCHTYVSRPSAWLQEPLAQQAKVLCLSSSSVLGRWLNPCGVSFHGSTFCFQLAFKGHNRIHACSLHSENGALMTSYKQQVATQLTIEYVLELLSHVLVVTDL